MSGGKPAFDPRLHVIDDEDDRKPSAAELRRSAGARQGDGGGGRANNPSAGAAVPYLAALPEGSVPGAAVHHSDSDEDESDEAVARRLQIELDQQDELTNRDKRRSNEDLDAALALRLMQEGSTRALGRQDSANEDPESVQLALRLEEEQQRQRQQQQQTSGGGGTDEEVARKLFEESLANFDPAQLPPNLSLSSHSEPSRQHQYQQQGMLPSSGMGHESDEALARKMFEESLANFKTNPSSIGSALPGETDEEMARRYFQHSLGLLTHAGTKGSGGNSNHEADEDLARRLQAQSIVEGREEGKAGRGGRAEGASTAAGANKSNDDEALARQMQNLEALGIGGEAAAAALANLRNKKEPSAESEYELMRRLRQEQEDEMIARQFATQGSTPSLSGVDSSGRRKTAPSPVAMGGKKISDPPALSTRSSTGSAGARQAAAAAAAAVPPSAARPVPRSTSSPTPTATPSLAGAGNARPQSQHPGEMFPPPIADPTPNVPPVVSSAEAPADKKKKMGGRLLGKLMNRKQGGPDGYGGGQVLPPEALPIPPPPTRDTSRPGPFPHSVSISQMLPILPQPTHLGGQQVGGHRGVGPDNAPTPSVPTATSGDKKKHSVPVCSVCKKPAPSYLSTLGKKYHPECFMCMGCHETIDHSSPFAFTVGEGGEKHPLHRKCYAELYGIKCAVCRQSIPTGADGKVSYVKHPFFDNERMCPRHAQNPGRRCTGCHRFEPEGHGFADLGDGDRCVCMSCCRTVVVDSTDAKPLWEKVIHFFEVDLGLPIWGDMRDVPVLVVGHDALNDQLQSAGGAHSGSSQIMTRGLCLSEHQSGRRIAMQTIQYNRTSGSFLPVDVEEKGFTYFRVPDPSKRNPNSSVTAILCMSGLPRDLTASILAHEATHAWFKLHPDFNTLDSQDAAEASPPGDDSGPSDEKLRQYFKFSIETDENDVYGMGYRSAAKAYANIGIEALLSHIVMYREFPEV